MADRNKRKTFTGTVTSRTGDKSVKVTHAYRVPHRVYSKEINRKTAVMAHDEKNECAAGDKVLVMETRPISKLKRWRISQILVKAPRLEPADAQSATA